MRPARWRRVVPVEPVLGRSTTSPTATIRSPLRREPGRITIGTDPDRRPLQASAPQGPSGRAESRRPAGSIRVHQPSVRAADEVEPPRLPTAIGVGLAMAAVFIIAVVVSPKLVMAVVVVVILLASVEYFDKVSEKGYRPATIIGIICLCHLAARRLLGGRAGLAADPRSSPSSPACITFIGAQEPRVCADAQHGHHDARRDVDRHHGLVRGADPAVLQGHRVPCGVRHHQHQHRHGHALPLGDRRRRQRCRRPGGRQLGRQVSAAIAGSARTRASRG